MEGESGGPIPCVMMTESTTNGSKAVLIGFLLVLGVAIVGGGAWFVLGPGSGVQETHASNGVENPAPVSAARVIEERLAAARTYSSNQEYGKAEAILRSAVEAHVEDQALRLAYAEVLLSLEKTEEAYEQYEAALAIGPRDPVIEFNAGTLAMATDRPERALEHYSMARAASPQNAEIALYLGAVQHQLGMTSEAKASLLSALQMDASLAEAGSLLAQISLDENDPNLALGYVRRAREAEPEQLAHRILEARVLRRLNKPEEALTLLMALTEDQLYTPMVLEICAGCMGMLGQQAEAAALYEEAMRRESGEPMFAFQAAIWRERAGETESALAHAKRAQMLGHPQAGAMAERLSGE